MELQLIIIMAACLLIVLPTVGYILHVVDHRDKVKVNAGAGMYINKQKSSPYYRIYGVLFRVPLIRGYLDKIGRRYELLYPGEPKQIASKAAQVAILTWILCFIEITLIYSFEPSLQNGILAIYLVFVINNEIINLQISNAEIRMLEEMSVFISEVNHNYHINRLVDDAILLSMGGLGYEMKMHANRLYEIVISDNLKEDVIKYNTTTHNRYFKMFLSLCINVIEFNDKKVNGQHLFSLNLRHLVREIDIEILKLKKQKFLFSGVVFVAVVVCLPIEMIKRFGISLVPELEDFYTGQGGIIFVGAIIISSMIVYNLINNLKEIKRPLPKNYRYLEKLEKNRVINKALDNYIEKKYGRTIILRDMLKRIGETISPRQLLLKQMITASVTIILCIGLVFYMHYCNKVNIISKVNNLETLTASTYNNQKELLAEAILTNVNENKDKPVTQEQVLEMITGNNVFYNTKLNETIAQEVYTRIIKYQSEIFKWYELVVCVFASVIAFYMPYWMVFYKKRVLNMVMEDEVNQFNSIVYMMMYVDHTTVKDILEQMELFAYVFKQSLQECINDYNSGDMEALTKMKEREINALFRRLVDNLIRCDAMPIEKAFSEIISDRESYHDRRKQENEISVQKRADFAKPLSWIPAILVTIYLMLPLISVSIKALAEFQESTSSMGF